MIAGTEDTAPVAERVDVWARLSAPLPNDAVMWRQDGKVIARDGRFFARFVAYVDANTVRERLDSVVPGEWDLTLELLPPLPHAEETEGMNCAFRARLQILGVIREDVGTGRDYKQSATDAFKRAAVRFGIAHELYDYGQNWVEMDSDSRNAKPVEDPAQAYARRNGNAATRNSGDAVTAPRAGRRSPAAAEAPPVATDPFRSPAAAAPSAEGTPSCPRCGGRMWDNRQTKRNPNAPDFRCRNRACEGVIWPTRLVPAATPTPPVEAAPPAGDTLELVPAPDRGASSDAA